VQHFLWNNLLQRVVLMGSGLARRERPARRAREYRAARRLLAGHDLYEGNRAAIIDRDKNPS
jgi:hypothetical protein